MNELLFNSINEVGWEEILNRYDNHKIGSKDPFDGCVADFYEVSRINPAWRTVKDQGNDQLKQGNQENALEMYSFAASLVEHRFIWKDIILHYIQREKESKTSITIPIGHTLLSEILSIRELAVLICEYAQPALPYTVAVRFGEGEEMSTCKEPNRPAAVCYGNRAAVLMNQGKFDAALVEARKAVSLCPEYLKAHERIAKCLTELGDTEAANRKEKELHEYKHIRPILPHYAMHLLIAGWINWVDATFMGDIRFGVILRWMKRLQSRETDTFLTMIFSLVNFKQGQWVNCAFTYIKGWGAEEGWDREYINSVTYCALDSENGNDLELPPLGRASAKSRLVGPYVIAQYVYLALLEGLTVTRIVLAKGLYDMVPEVKEEIKRFIPASFKPQCIEVEATSAPSHGPTFAEYLG